MSLTRQYATACDLSEFEDPRIAEVIPQISPDASAARPHRKFWELAMAALFLEDVGRLDGEAEILDVAAGADTILFWLANRAKRVVATDIYGRGDFAWNEAADNFLADPSAFAPYAYPEEKLEVLDMDALQLEFPDESFDAVVSFGSIEHFGKPADISRAIREMARVLRPGGHALITTEVFIDLSPADALLDRLIQAVPVGPLKSKGTRGLRPLGDIFKLPELQKVIVDASELELMQPLAINVSGESRKNPHRINGDGSTTSATGDPFPHIVVSAHWSLFTSVCLPLVKPA